MKTTWTYCLLNLSLLTMCLSSMTIPLPHETDITSSVKKIEEPVKIASLQELALKSIKQELLSTVHSPWTDIQLAKLYNFIPTLGALHWPALLDVCEYVFSAQTTEPKQLKRELAIILVANQCEPASQQELVELIFKHEDALLYTKWHRLLDTLAEETVDEKYMQHHPLLKRAFPIIVQYAPEQKQYDTLKAMLYNSKKLRTLELLLKNGFNPDPRNAQQESIAALTKQDGPACSSHKTLKLLETYKANKK
jgi:hypothetical protein